MRNATSIILSALLAGLVWFILIANFTNFMAGTLVVLGSLSFMWIVAEGIYWFFRSDEK
jgi:hypothetical protein